MHLVLPGSRHALPDGVADRLARTARRLQRPFRLTDLRRASGLSLSLCRRWIDGYCDFVRYDGPSLYRASPLYRLRERCAQGSELPPGHPQPTAAVPHARPSEPCAERLLDAAQAANESAPGTAMPEAQRVVTSPETDR